MIIVKNISKSVAHTALFENISFKIGDGQKVGLVGPNGAGKTTLLKIILGTEEPDSGAVLLNDEVVGYLPQKLITQPNEKVGSYLLTFLTQEWETYKIDQVLAEVGLKGIHKNTFIHALSGGQKMRVALAGVLLKEPTALLLDEPTNNLDVKNLQWLEKYIQNFEGKVLVISHDRYFLDACIQKIIELDPFTHSIAEYGGNYSSYKEQKILTHQNTLENYKRQQQKEKRMKEWIAQKQQQLTHHPNPKVARQLQAMKTRYEREILRDQLDKPLTYKSFKLQSVAKTLHQDKVILSLKDFALRELLLPSSLIVLAQDRVSLQGENGSGKTTLIKEIMGKTNFHTGVLEIGANVSLGYFSQEHEFLVLQESVISHFMRQTGMDESRARSVLGKFLFSGRRVFSSTKNLSEGEKARLLIAIIIHQQNDFLLLDEPTNHLDLESREVLSEALRAYEGGFLVVSHDRYFLEQIGVNRVLTINEKNLIG